MNMRGAFPTLAAGLTMLCAVSCHNTTPTPPAPPLQPVPQAAPKPSIISFTAQPSTIERGQRISINWSVANATGVQIDNGIGQVTLDDHRTVNPTETTTYHLTATSPGGTAEASATVTVSMPPPPAEATTSQTRRARAEVLAERLQDIHFDYNTGDIRAVDLPVIQADASVLQKLFEVDPTLVVVIEGHCDERGSAEYNIALGDRRASVVRVALVNLGISAAKLNTISFGKERPVCVEENEDCYAKDRRAHLALGQ